MPALPQTSLVCDASTPERAAEGEGVQACGGGARSAAVEVGFEEASGCDGLDRLRAYSDERSAEAPEREQRREKG
jgi:hypothetical protein